MCADLQKLAKTSDPPVLASQFSQEKDSFWHMASNILNKPKPKVEPPPPQAPPKEAEGDAAKEDESDAAKAGAESAPNSENPTQPPTSVNGEMDVD